MVKYDFEELEETEIYQRKDEWNKMIYSNWLSKGMDRKTRNLLDSEIEATLQEPWRTVSSNLKIKHVLQ